MTDAAVKSDFYKLAAIKRQWQLINSQVKLNVLCFYTAKDVAAARARLISATEEAGL